MHKLGEFKGKNTLLAFFQGRIASVHNRDVRIQRLAEEFENNIPQSLVSHRGPFANNYSKKTDT